MLLLIENSTTGDGQAVGPLPGKASWVFIDCVEEETENYCQPIELPHGVYVQLIRPGDGFVYVKRINIFDDAVQMAQDGLVDEENLKFAVTNGNTITAYITQNGRRL